MSHGRTKRNGGPCVTPGCAGRAKAKGFCSACYGRHWRTGSAARVARRPVQAEGEDPRESDAARARKLALAEKHYQNAVGVQARLYWRGQMLALQG